MMQACFHSGLSNSSGNGDGFSVIENYLCYGRYPEEILKEIRLI